MSIGTAKVHPDVAPSKHLNRLSERRLWDDIGDVWELIDSKLTSDGARKLLRDPSVRICIHDDFAQPLRWISPEDRSHTIRTVLAPWFAEDFHKRTRGRYFTMKLWAKGARRILLFGAD